MTQIIKSRKERANFTIEQKLDYAKLSTPYLCKDLAKYFKKQHSAPLKYPQFVTA
jgi:hypothetical protein